MQFCAPLPCFTFLFFKVVGSADAEKGEGWDEDSRRKKILTLPSLCSGEEKNCILRQAHLQRDESKLNDNEPLRL